MKALEAHGASSGAVAARARGAARCGRARVSWRCSRSGSAGRSRRALPSRTASRKPSPRVTARREDPYSAAGRLFERFVRAGDEAAGGTRRVTAYKIDHLGVAVASIDEALSVYRALGLVEVKREEVPTQKVTAAFLPVGESRIELLEPTSGDSPGGEVPREARARASTTSASPSRTSRRRSRTSRRRDSGSSTPRRCRAPTASASPSSTRRPGDGVLIELSETGGKAAP